MNVNKDQPQDTSKQDLWDKLDAEEASPAAKATDAELESAVRQEAAPAPEADAKQATNDDPIALKEELAGLKVVVSQLQTRLRNTEGHIGGLTNQLRDARAAAQATRNSGGDAPTSSELNAAVGDPAAMAKLKEEYPEFGELFDKVLSANIAPLVTKVRELEQRSTQVAQVDVGQQLDTFRKEWLVETKHPGWQEEVRTPAFTGWLQSQPREVQMLAHSDDPRDAIRLLDLRVAAKQRTQPAPQTHLQAAAAIPSGRGIGNVKPVDLDGMSREQLWKYYDNLESQRA